MLPTLIPRSISSCILITALLSHVWIVFGQDTFDWESIEPSDNLTWVNCYSGTQCARFKVPLDYSEPNKTSVVLALIRIPSPAIGTPVYRGPVLVNPGGPGGSGVDLVLQSGKLLTSILGEQFDLLSFDPRGVGRSTPNVSFFASDIERAQWDYGPDSSNVEASTDAIPRQWASSQILGHLAQDRDNGILPYITTDKVAQDMLRIVEAHGQEKLQYYGASYGSVLGATFAAMFPDRVERMALDGVIDMQGYYATDWSKEDTDTDKTLQAFFDGCYAAGPEACAFYAPSSVAIAHKYANLLKSVRAQPIPAYTSSSSGYGVVDYATLQDAVFSSLYTPYESFAPLAQILANLTNGSALFNGSPLTAEDAQVAIICGDGAKVDSDAQDLEKYYQSIKNTSSFSSIFAQFRVRCSGWRVNPQHFTGPISGNTSFPILMIGNTEDPVTPLSAAKKTSAMFPGSVVLTQDSPGHTSFSIPTACTLSYVQQYFQNGTMPPPGTVCPVNGTLFPHPASNVTSRALDDDQSSLLDVANALRGNFKVPRLPIL